MMGSFGINTLKSEVNEEKMEKIKIDKENTDRVNEGKSMEKLAKEIMEDQGKNKTKKGKKSKKSKKKKKEEESSDEEKRN